MKKNIYITFSLLIVLLSFSACDGWVDDAKTPNDSLTWDDINRPGMIASVSNNKLVDGPLINYIRTTVGEAASTVFLNTGAMTDEIAPSEKPNVLTYKSLRNDNVTSNGGQTDGLWTTLQNLRARSEELLVIQNNVANADYPNLDVVRSYGRFTGNFYCGYACDLLAQCFSSVSDQEGGVWVNGEMVSHKDLYQKALDYYKAAIIEANDEGLKKYSDFFKSGLATRTVEAMIVKLHMHRENYSEAAKHVGNALSKGDSFNVIYNQNGSTNGLYSVIGIYALNAQVDNVIPGELRNAAERKAIQTKLNKDKNLYLTSLDKYSPMTITDYNEMQLIRAELVLRSELSGNALNLVNSVISSYDASSVETTVPNLVLLTHLRRVYLYLRGERIADARRKLLPPAKQSVWDVRKNKWMPFPENEKS